MRVTRPLRIGICAPYDLGRHGGVNSHIRSQAAALRRLGHEVSVFGASSTPLTDGEISLGPCISLVIGNTETGFGADPRSWRRVREFFRERRFDVIHMHEPLMPLPSWFVLRQATAPVVATFHACRSRGHQWYRYRWIFHSLMRRVRVRLAVSEAAKRTVAEHFPGDYEVVPNAIDVSRFARTAPRPSTLAANQRHVLYVGRLEPRKGVDRLIHAMARVQQRVPGVALAVVGDGPDREGLEALARSLNVTATFTGRVSDEALPGYYHAADVVCSPALADESFGMVLLEAMAAGRPIVATNIAGYAELLGEANVARLAEADDPAALERELSAVLGDPALARTLGERGAIAAQQYDWSVVAARLEAIYSAARGNGTSGRNEYGSEGENTSDASERFDRPLTR